MPEFKTEYIRIDGSYSTIKDRLDKNYKRRQKEIKKCRDESSSSSRKNLNKFEKSMREDEGMNCLVDAVIKSNTKDGEIRESGKKIKYKVGDKDTLYGVFEKYFKSEKYSNIFKVGMVKINYPTHKASRVEPGDVIISSGDIIYWSDKGELIIEKKKDPSREAVKEKPKKNHFKHKVGVGETVYGIFRKYLGKEFSNINMVKTLKIIHPDNKITITNKFKNIPISPGDIIAWNNKEGVLIITKNRDSSGENTEKVSNFRFEYTVKDKENAYGIFRDHFKDKITPKLSSIHKVGKIIISHPNGDNSIVIDSENIPISSGDVMYWDPERKALIVNKNRNPSKRVLKEEVKKSYSAIIDKTLEHGSKNMLKGFREELEKEIKKSKELNKLKEEGASYKEFDKACTNIRVDFTKNYISKLSNTDFEKLVRENSISEKKMLEHLKGIMKLRPGLVPYGNRDKDLYNKYKDAIKAASKAYSINPLWIKQVIWVESRFHPFAVSEAEATGLMQTMSSVFMRTKGGGTDDDKNLSFRTTINPYNPVENIKRGTLQLAKLRSYFLGKYFSKKDIEKKDIEKKRWFEEDCFSGLQCRTFKSIKSYKNCTKGK
jgi:hypothetical protein